MARKPVWLALVLAVVLAGAVWAIAACGSGDEGTGGGDENAVEGGTLRVHIGEPSHLDPGTAFESEGIQVDQAIFDSLTQFDFKTNELKPDVATSWDVNDDATMFTFHLKEGTKFHNGREVVAADFKYAWERLSNPATGSNYGTLLSMVKGYADMQKEENPATELSGVVAVDDYTLQVTLASPFADFAMVAAMVQCAPVPKEEVVKDAAAYAEKPIGNGPFMLSEPWSHNQYVKVVKFPDYTGTQPKIDGIDFKIYKDNATALLDFKAGNVDYCQLPTGVYAASVAEYGKSEDGLTANPGHQVLDGMELGIYEIVINTQNSLFKDKPDLRRAISLAINRQAICTTLYEGVRKPATSIIPEGVVGYQDGAFESSKYDVEAAKAALAKAGYPGGAGLPTIKLSFNNNADHGPIMELVQADLKAIGINATLDGMAGPAYWELAGNGGDEFFIGRSGWIADYPTIDNFIFNLFYSTGGNNYSHLQDPTVDKAIDDARKIADEGKRVTAEQAAVKTIGDLCPDVPVMYYHHLMVTSARVHNFVLSPMIFMDFVNCWISE
jgi:oligopeptide transport system substrate-binding protein